MHRCLIAVAIAMLALNAIPERGRGTTAAHAAGPDDIGQAAASPRYEYRVVVPTTSGTQSWQVVESLERNVNRMAAAGFEVAAFVGGSRVVVDALLDRSAPGTPATSSLALVIMARPAGVAVRAREYRLLHASNSSTVGLDAFTTKLKDDGFRLSAFAHEGGAFHAAFERTPGPVPVEYRIYANKSRNSWMKQLQDDPSVLARLSRVVPMQLDLALVELGPASDAPGAIEWAPDTTVVRFGSSLQQQVNDRAKDGFHVNLLRIRNNNVDVLLVKPAGSTGPAPTYTLDKGPWGSRCGTGAMAGADVATGGDMFCAADTTRRSISNEGLDLTIRAYDSAKGAVLFRPVNCEVQARLGSTRLADRWLAAATSLEQELNAKGQPGYRVTRALAAVGSFDQMRVYAIASTASPTTGAGAEVRDRAIPRLAADRDEALGGQSRRYEDQINDALARNANLEPDTTVWVEIRDTGRDRSVRLTGCTSTRQDIGIAESAVRSLLVRTPYDAYTVRTDIVVDRLR